MLRRQKFFASVRPLGKFAGWAAGVAVAVVLAACSSGSDGPKHVVTPPKDPANTLEEARKSTPIAVSGTAPVRKTERFQTRDDVDFYRLKLTGPGTLAISTTGVDTKIEAFDRDGTNLGGISGSLIVTIEQDLIRNKAGEVFVKISPVSGKTGAYTMIISYRMVVTPAVDPPNTLGEARRDTPIAVTGAASVRRSEQFQTRDDVDFYRLGLTQPGTLTISTTGVDTRIRAFDRDGNDLGGISGSLIVTIGQDLIRNKGGEVFVEISPASDQIGGYQMTVDHSPTATPTPPTMTTTPSG